MRALLTSIVSIVSIVSIFAVTVLGAARAQTPASSPAPADAAAAFGYVVAGGPPSSGLAVENAPALTTEPIKRGGTILTVTLHHAGVGRLMEAVSSNALSLDAGALLFAATFRGSAEQAEPLLSWCGPGHGGLFGMAITVCIVGTPDGKARLLSGLITRVGEDYRGPMLRSYIHSAPSWYVQAIQPDRLARPFPRPRIVAVDTSQLPSLTLRLENRGEYRDKLVVTSSLGLTTGEGGSQLLRTYELPLAGGAAHLPFGSFNLVLSQAVDGLHASWEAASNPVIPRTSVTAVSAARLAPTKFVIDGARVDVASLTPATGPVEEGGALVQGVADHWRTARADIDASVLGLHVRTAPGALFHEIEIFGQDDLGARSVRRFWCGPMRYLGLPTMRCLSIQPDGKPGDVVSWVVGPEWMAVVPRSVSQSLHAVQAEVRPSEDDLIGPMKFTLRLDGVGRRLSVRAEVERNGETAVIWKGAVPFDAAGVARLPLWSRLLVASKAGAPAGAAVVVRLEPNLDGAGPLEAALTARQ